VIALRATDGPSVRDAFRRADLFDAQDPCPADESADEINARRRCAIQASNIEDAIAHPNPAPGSRLFSVPGVTGFFGFTPTFDGFVALGLAREVRS
jgi:hypothetical protein